MTMVDGDDEGMDEVQAATQAMRIATGDSNEQPARSFRLEVEDDGTVAEGSVVVDGSPAPSTSQSITAAKPMNGFEEGFHNLASEGDQ